MWRTLMIGSLLGLLSGCSGLPFGQSSDHPDYSAEGKASYYGARHHGKRTASGERFDQNQLTAAHRTLPFGTLVEVTNLVNERSAILRITDRGPYTHGRVLDVSIGAAKKLDFVGRGVTQCRVEVLRGVEN